MRKRGVGIAVLSAILLASGAGLRAADHYRVLNGPKDLYFGHISFIEPGPDGAAPIVLREGSTLPEEGVLNLPIGPGDRVRTAGGRRCEIQFDSGTIIRLDVDTEIKVETILAQSLSSPDELSVVSLPRGRVYVMYKEYGRRELFQVMTPNAALKLRPNAVAVVSAAADGATEAQVRYGRAQMLFGPAADRLVNRAVRKGERLVVLADHQAQLAAALEDSAFDLWNKDVNAHFEQLHEGLTPLPKPVQKLPPAVFYFAQTYGNRYGEWLWDDLYGYVWRPFIDNGRYPWGWSPYYYGRWSSTGGQMFWVPQEPWGWIPYHLGIWQWDKKRGWFWLPGSMFSPAWVTWDFYFGYACWRPWSLFDWMSGDPYMYGSDPYWNSHFRYLDGAWQYDWPYGTGGDGAPLTLVKTVIRKNELKQPAAGALPLPAELRGIVKKVVSAYRAGDVRVRESAAAVPGQLVFVAKGDLASGVVHEKARTWDKVPKWDAPAAVGSAGTRRIVDPRREAVRVYRRADIPGPVSKPKALPAAPAVRASAAPAVRPVAPPVRFRDWNPDMRVARELGVRIEYSSLRNEVRCPELRITSRDRDRAGGPSVRMTPHGVVASPGVSASGGSSTGSSGSGASTTSTVSASPRGAAPERASGGGQSTKGGGSEKIKN